MWRGDELRHGGPEKVLVSRLSVAFPEDMMDDLAHHTQNSWGPRPCIWRHFLLSQGAERCEVASATFVGTDEKVPGTTSEIESDTIAPQEFEHEIIVVVGRRIWDEYGGRGRNVALTDNRLFQPFRHDLIENGRRKDGNAGHCEPR